MSACHDSRALASIFVAFDRLDNKLLNGCVVFMVQCLDEVDMELGGSGGCWIFGCGFFFFLKCGSGRIEMVARERYRSLIPCGKPKSKANNNGEIFREIEKR